MASLGFSPNVKSCQADTVLLDFSCQSVGTSTGAIAAANILAGRSIKALTGTYAATGVYTFVLPYGSAFPTANVFVGHATARGAAVFHPQVDTITSASGQMTVVVKCYDMAGSAVAPASTAGNIIDVSIVASNNTGA